MGVKMCKGTDELQELMSYIGEKNLLQKKYLFKSIETLTEKEEKELRRNIDYYLEVEGVDITYIGDAYLLFVADTLKETKYFAETGHYQYSKQSEVAEKVYFNQEYMKMYMLGVNLSGYLWLNHRKIHRYYEEIMERDLGGDTYLEIGPGHGQYFLEALNRQKYRKYLGVDISQTSVAATVRFVENHKEELFQNMGGGGSRIQGGL